jgi:adenine-specific DNA methylase
MKVALEYAPEIGSLEREVNTWKDKIHTEAKSNIEEYYPTENPDHEILNSSVTYLLKCDSCEGKIPLVMKWWLNKTSNGGDAVKPIYESGEVSYEHVKVQNTDDDYDPQDGPVTRGSAECPHCGVVTESDEVREKIKDGEFEYSVYGVNYENGQGEWKFRAGSEVDMRGMEKAAERIETDFGMMDFLSEPIPEGRETERLPKHGMNEWRDIYSPRQLVVHYEYLQAFDEFKNDIKSEYNGKKSEAVLSLLALASSRAISFNTRLSQWYDEIGCPQNLFTDNNFAPKKMFADNNMSAPRRGYLQRVDQVLESYEDLVSYTKGSSAAELAQIDAANLPQKWRKDSVDVAVVDPPYYSSIMYAELSDVFYILQKEYLKDIHPSLFNSKLTNKDDEAVANPARFNEIANSRQSREELAREDYENKMTDIFSGVNEILSDKGVVTVMFTHRDMDAWDALTTAFIEAGFTISATHPIKTEQSDRVGMQGKASADSSIFLIGRKEEVSASTESTLWEDIKRDIAVVAEQEARSIIESGHNISKTDMAISAYGPTLHKFAKEYPVVNKKGERVRPREALSEAREAVTEVIAGTFLKTSGIDNLDTLTRWYILAWLIYENDTFPYDEGNQLGVAAGVDINDIKRPTKIWGKSRGDIQLKNHDDRVQDIVLLKDDSVDNPSSRKYPVDPTDTRFTYTIDAVHSAIHVYEREGARAAWDWLTERNLKSDDAFEVAVTALLEVLPEDNDMHETLVNLISGETGEYLDINVDHIDMSGVDRQTSLDDHKE